MLGRSLKISPVCTNYHTTVYVSMSGIFQKRINPFFSDPTLPSLEAEEAYRVAT
jgi:hypothetical protein